MLFTERKYVLWVLQGLSHYMTGEKGAGEAMRSLFAHLFYITGKPKKGSVMFDIEGFKSNEELEYLLNEATEFVDTLPLK